MTQIIALAAIVIFAAIMVVIGIFSSKSTKTLDGFLLGGRNIGAWLTAFAYGTTYFSAVIFIGYAGDTGWNVGLSALWIGIGNAVIGCLAAWLLLAKRTRRMTRKLEARTMPEFFSARYDSPALKMYSAIIIFIFLVPYAATVYKGLGALFGSIFPNNFLGFSPTTVCTFIIAVLAAIYLVLGGYLASSINNFVQGTIMIVGVIVMCVSLINNPNVGGLSAAIEKLGEANPVLVSPFGGESWVFLLKNILLTSFGVWGLPQMVHKYYAIKDEAQIKKGTIIATIFAVIIGCGAYFAGSLGRFFVEANEAGAPVVGYDNVVPTMLNNAFGGSVGGNILLSIILLCVLSASISTLTSIVLTSSTSISVDICRTLVPSQEKYTPKKEMIFTRALCFLFIAISFILANFNFAIITTIMSFSWGVVSGCFIGPYVWGLYSKKITKAGAWSGILCGVVVFAVWFILSRVNPSITFDTALCGSLAMLLSFIVVPVVSLFTPKLDEKTVDNAFGE